MSLTASERETVIAMNDAEDTAAIYTHQRSIITKLRRNPAVTLVEEGNFEGTVWARFEMPARLVSFRSSVTTRVMTDEQKAAGAARLAAHRAKLAETAS
jgi:hypothetical protein